MTPPAFSAVSKESLSDSVYRQLADKILRGELIAGAALPAERELSEALGVNRGAVREAIKRLQQARLVAVRQGGNSVVLDYLAEGGLELLPGLLVNAQGQLNTAVVRSIMAMRSALAPDIAAAAAQKGGAALADELDALLARMRADAGSLKALQAHALAFWRKLVERCGNIAFRLAFNSMTRTYSQAQDAMAAVLQAEFRDLENLGAIAAAVRRGDAETARSHGRLHVEIGRGALEHALDAVDAGGSIQ
ncbi:FadR family transcriptional regulator [Solimonas sp. K1W22B-7]|uniref:FadR/GntR family transcriptional regulator n=1 Tax=Solimonas sp. K1W22B-7 TaxID=2303331 RepID=UPI000E336EE3|nr:GntR family transcriptional regulator [Solimonas sp. K1W22B-7]AXQ31244.1 FadR family transcriptional regulator [Solimonas sp. K1W22B-7]